MKKHYLKLSYVAILFATVLLAGSCKKKTSDPAPAPVVETTNNANANAKPAAPNTDKRKTVAADEGTGRPPVTEVTVGDVKVLDPAQQRKQMTDTSKAGLDKVLGVNAAQLRSEATTENKDFGWFVADMTVDGKPWDDVEIQKSGMESVFFFNIDSSGYYWQFDNQEDSWTWGTYGIDAGLTTIAFDFDATNTPAQIWKIVKVTSDRLIVEVQLDANNDKIIDNVIIGLNGYDLSSEEFSGETEISPEENVFVGAWNEVVLQDTSFVPANPSNQYLINPDGTCAIIEGQNEPQYGSWVIEYIDDEAKDVFYIYITTYDSSLQTPDYVTKAYLVSVADGMMTVIDGESSSISYFQKMTSSSSSF